MHHSPSSPVFPLPVYCASPAVAAPVASRLAGDNSWFDAQDLATRFFWIDRASEQLGLSDYSATEQQCFEAFCAFSTRGVLVEQSPVFSPSVAQRVAHAVAAPVVKPRAGDYSINRACLGLSLHLYRAFLAEKGPKHRETLRYARLARADAARVIAATPVGGSL